jgi:tRNA-specific 2-thiouridylase
MNCSAIGIAMSGGVDSTAAAVLLKRHHPVAGFFMDIGQSDGAEQFSRCQAIGKALAIEVQSLDLREAFRERVLNYFTTTYLSGKTPNPCVVCNQHIKFGLLREAILAAGYEVMATGHYARIRRFDDGYGLIKGIDISKDQSYFLSRIALPLLASVRLPMGDLTKAEAYRITAEHGLTDCFGKQSQDVCFLADSTVAGFISAQAEGAMQPGPISTTAGVEIGRHQGLYQYTIGQRRGLNLPDHSPWYVIRIESLHNRLIVGKEDELYMQTVQCRSPYWLVDTVPKPGTVYTAKLRSTHGGAEARIDLVDEQMMTLYFSTPQRAVCPGQFCVLFKGERVIGSAEIESAW